MASQLVTFLPNKKYKLRGGGWAKVLCVDKPGKYPIVYYDQHSDIGEVMANGIYDPDGLESGMDMLPEEYSEPKTVTRDVWVWMFQDGSTTIQPQFATMALTREDATTRVIGSAKATITVVQGIFE